MVFLIINSIDILEEHQNADGDHDTFVERFQEDVTDRRRQQVKGMMKRKVIGTMGTTQTRNQVLLFKAKLYDEEDRRKLSSSSKIVLLEEGPGSTVKI